VEVPAAGCWRLWVRLRSLLRPRRGLEGGTFLPSGEVTETEGDGRVSNIDCDEGTFLAAVGSLKVRKDVPFLMFRGKLQPQANRVTLQAAGSYSSTNDLFRTGGVFGTGNRSKLLLSGTRPCFGSPRLASHSDLQRSWSILCSRGIS
jgi:hypothetical protein